jgi:Tfp pilus assembly protein FimT
MRTSIGTQLKGARGGYMLLELIIGIAVVVILASITALSLSRFSETQALNNGVDEVVALINQARSRTVAAEGGTYYGVHLEERQAVLFSGPTYSVGAVGNQPVPLDVRVKIDVITLSGGGDDIVFEEGMGDTTGYGTFVIKRLTSTLGQKTVTVSRAGAVSSSR